MTFCHSVTLSHCDFVTICIWSKVWDTELSEVAQAHADQCKFAHDCSECRRVGRFGVGQNLYIFKQTVRLANTDWERAVTDWYDEVELFSKDQVEPFQFSPEYGHYTALAWADTDRVGCGATSYRSGVWLATLYTCNYGPVGNYISGQMYSPGQACSQCPGGWGCSQQYQGLCSPPNTGRNVTITATTKPTTTTRAPTTTRALTTTTTRALTTPRRLVFTTRRPRPVTTRRPPAVQPVVPGGERLMLSCDFQDLSESLCEMRGRGVGWTRETEAGGNNYVSTQLVYRDKTDLILSRLLPPPRHTSLLCVQFKYKKYSLGRKRKMWCRARDYNMFVSL